MLLVSRWRTVVPLVGDYKQDVPLDPKELVHQSATLTLPEMQKAILDGVAAWRHGPLADDVSLVLVEVR